MNSIQRQLTFLLLAGMLASFALAGGILQATVKDALLSQFDASLTDKAASITTLFDLQADYLEIDDGAETMPEFEGGDSPQYFACWFDNGTEILRSRSLGEGTLPRQAGTDDEPLFWDMALADGRQGRAIGLVFNLVPEDEESDEEEDDDDEGSTIATGGKPVPITLVVARSREELNGSLAALTTGLLLSAGVALLLVWWGVTFSVRRGLAPLRQLGDDVERIDAASLSRRVDRNVPQELAPFKAKLNDLFQRLEGAFAKERRMTAAMAHELRTPIAELRSASDVAQRWPDDSALLGEVVTAAGDVALRMSNSIEAMMRYCRLESGQTEPECERVELAALLDELWKPYENLAKERGLELRNEIPERAAVETDRGLLSVVFNNLLHNAASFGSSGLLRAWWVDSGVIQTLHMSNRTDQLTPDDLQHLTEPFWRKDLARSDGQHSGLGLTLVISIAGVLGDTVQFSIEDGCFIVSLGLGGSGSDSSESSSNGHGSATGDANHASKRIS